MTATPAGPAAACRSPGLEGGRQPRPGQGEQEAAPVKGIQQHQLDGGDQVGQIAEQGRRQQEQKEQAAGAMRAMLRPEGEVLFNLAAACPAKSRSA